MIGGGPRSKYFYWYGVLDWCVIAGCLDDETSHECTCVVPSCLLQKPKKSRPEREGKLIGGNDQTHNSRKVLPGEFLLNDEPRERDQIPKPEAEEYASEIEHRRRWICREQCC